MSGSLTWRTYTGDNGTQYSVFRDESNSESVTSTGVAPLLGAFVPGAPGISRLIKERYVNTTLSTNPLIKKKFVIGTIGLFGAITAGTTITENTTPTQLWNITGKVGERVRIPTSVDSGQTDGDAT